MVLTASSSMAQAPTFPVNFEDGNLTWTFVPFGGGELSRVANPDPTGINTSGFVAQMVKNPGDPWGGSWFQLGQTIDLNVSTEFRVKVWSPRAGATLTFKIENETNGGIFFEQPQTIPVANQWTELTFDFSAANRTSAYHKIVLIFDNGTVGTGAPNYLFYVDDIEQGSAPPPPPPARPTLPVSFEETTIDWSTQFTPFGGGVLSRIENPDRTGINTSAHVARMVKNAPEPWGGAFFDLASPVNLNASREFRIKVWSPREGARLLFKIENRANGGIFFEQDRTIDVANAWTELVYDFSAANGAETYDRIVLISDLGVPGNGTSDFTFYIDGIRQVMASPVMNGTFDGEGVWGAPIAVGDGNPGWANANASALYVRYDDTYAYFGASFTAESWMQFVFLVDAKVGGGTADTWSRQITYNHADAPDFICRGDVNGGYAERHTWNGTSWDGVGSAAAASEYGSSTSFAECRVPLAALGSPSSANVQFLITGNNNDHGSFSSVPRDNVSAGWNPPQSTTSLSNYATNALLPVELTSFSALASGRTAILSWMTASETNNAGFEVETLNGSAWTSLGFVEGQGTTDQESSYRFTTGDLALGVHTFRLRQVDFDGTTSFSPTVEVAILADDAMVTLTGANPFRTETAVQIATPSAQQVRATLYDVLGRQVAEVFSGEVSGVQNVRVNVDVPAGMYFLRVTGDTFSHTTTLTRVR